MYIKICNKNRKPLKKQKHHIFLKKMLSLPIVYSKLGHEYEKYLKKKNQLKC